MHVFVTGATGVLGTRLVELLADCGHEVTGLARDDAGDRCVAERGGTPVRGDVCRRDSLERAVPDDVDVVVHAATAIPRSRKPSDEEWARNDRVRRGGAENLVAVAGDDADRFLFPSVVWLARQPDGSRFDETAERHPERATRSAAETEDLLRRAGERRGFAVTVLRFGFFYAPDGHTTRQIADGLLSGTVPVVGGGLLGRRDAALSLIHADDAARAAADALDAGANGCYHVVDDEPVTTADYFSALAERLDAPAPRRVPAWLARFFVGKTTATVLSSPMPTSADRFESAVGWEPEYPTYREGLDQVVETWRANGTLAELRGDGSEGATDPDAASGIA